MSGRLNAASAAFRSCGRSGGNAACRLIIATAAFVMLTDSMNALASIDPSIDGVLSAATRSLSMFTGHRAFSIPWSLAIPSMLTSFAEWMLFPMRNPSAVTDGAGSVVACALPRASNIHLHPRASSPSVSAADAGFRFCFGN